MCGIAGVVRWDDDDSFGSKELVREMLGTIVHRGPDDEGIWQDRTGRVTLGHRRLSIIDLTPAGHQPMVTHCGTSAVTFNGEIYNFAELRQSLEGDAQFSSRTDTEVLLCGYQRWGLDVVPRLVGMFAAAIWDGTREQLVLVRDRVGEKPLYFAQFPAGIAFASELQALAMIPGLDCSINQDALSLYLRFQYVPAPLTIYKGVQKLLPGTYLIARPNDNTITKYWDATTFAAAPPLPIDDQEAIGELETLLRRAIDQQMISDVPLGAFLSGGIDSSTVVSFMTQLSTKTVKTFTIGFDVPGFDESAFAGAVAAQLNTDHTAVYLTEHQALEVIPQIPRIYGEPFGDSSALPTHLVAKIARRDVTVSLSGDGADEIFGGYPRYERLQKAYAVLRLGRPFRSILGASAPLFSRRLERAALLAGASKEEVYSAVVEIFDQREATALTGRCARLDEFHRAWRMAPRRMPARCGAMLADFVTYLPEALLVKVDRAAMAVSLETRCPFLDHRLVEFALRLPYRLRRKKVLLKKLAYRRIPAHLLERPKRGFAVPLAAWFRGQLRDLLLDTVTKPKLLDVGIQEWESVSQLLQEHLSGEYNHMSRLWALLALILWYDTTRPVRAEQKFPTYV